MKDKIIGWGVFAGIVLVVGIALFKSLANPPEAEEGNPYAAPEGDSPVAAEFGAIGDDERNSRPANVATSNTVTGGPAAGAGHSGKNRVAAFRY